MNSLPFKQSKSPLPYSQQPTCATYAQPQEFKPQHGKSIDLCPIITTNHPTTCISALLGKLIVFQPVQEIATLHGIRMFVPLFTRVHHSPYSQRNQFNSHPPILFLHDPLNSTPPSTPNCGVSRGLLSSGSPHQNPECFPLSYLTYYMFTHLIPHHQNI
jgi:hypothetical protein